MTNMTQFQLNSNDLSGEVPSELGQWTALELLQLYDNPKLTGSMPTEICGNLQQGVVDATILTPCPQGNSGIECPEECCQCRW